MPLEENTYDEIPSGRVDTLVKAIERIERLEKQLKIAAQALDEVAICMTCDEVEIREINPDFCADQAALDAVNEAKAKIKDLEKCEK